MANPKQDHRFSVSSLLSPPEMKRLDSFSTSPAAFDSALPLPTTVRAPGSNVRQSRAGLPPSPPVSPYDNVHKEEEDTTRDPPLYPSSAASEANEPLFPADHESLIARHVASSNMGGARPTPEEYRLVVACKATVFAKYSQDPKGYMRKEKATWGCYGPKRNSAKKTLRTLAPAPAGVRKQKAAAARTPRAPRVIKRTPKAAVLDDFQAAGASGSVDAKAVPSPASAPKPRAPAPRDDVDFRSLPDYAPPVSLLPEDGRRGLKADWKGQPLDLSSDPDRLELHPAELAVASTLRLSCAVYLANKRRIFAARVRSLLRGDDFNKTKAQQACKIDVNKASKLWAAYDRIGWFDPRLFQRHLAGFVDIE